MHYADSRMELGQAADKPNGLAVLGFFFEVSSLPAHCALLLKLPLMMMSCFLKQVNLTW